MQTAPQLRLSELSARIGDTIRNAFQHTSFWVVADVTSHTFKASSSYHYFELVEKDTGSNNLLARFSAKAWGAGARQIEQFERITGQRFTNNIQVLVNVTVEFHPAYGLQLQVNAIDPNFTLGQIEQQRLATLQRLVTENPSFIQLTGDTYITRNNRLTLRPVLQTLAVISARASAGLQDFRHSLEENAFGYRFRIDEYFTGVQGESNASSIRDTLTAIYLSGIPYDAVIITRGGGAQTDLLMFDNYLVGQAIAKFPIPIITGIGHHKNTTIADLMANSPTRTPTKAAEFIIAHNRTFEESLLMLQQIVVIHSQQVLAQQAQNLVMLQSGIVNATRDVLHAHKGAMNEIRTNVAYGAQRILYNRQATLVNLSTRITAQPQLLVAHKLHTLRSLAANIRIFNAQYVRNQRSRLNQWATIMKLVSPANTLQRGFALIKYNGNLVSHAHAIAPGETVDIILARETLKTIVTEKTPHHGDNNEL
jgi:exodeoxyribonuclease VII large subunit